MCVNTEYNKHQEKADSPELRQWHHGCCLRVSDERQTRTFVLEGYKERGEKGRVQP